MIPSDITNPELRQLYLGGIDAGKLMRVNGYQNGKPYHVYQKRPGKYFRQILRIMMQ